MLLCLTTSPTCDTCIPQKAQILASKLDDQPTIESRVASVYKAIQTNSNNVPTISSFSQALAGFYDLKAHGLVTKNILTIVDFSISSANKRLWIIDLTDNTVLLHSLVSHGINSGGEFASHFSNAFNSNKSSLGFFVTAESYFGKNGLTLKLDGMDQGVNDRARSRGLVLHGAAYANPAILFSQNYLGRSQGCPAVPEKLNAKIIGIIKGKSCLFIYHQSRDLQPLSILMS